MTAHPIPRLGAAVALQPDVGDDLRKCMTTDGVRSAWKAADQTNNPGTSEVVGVALGGYTAFLKAAVGIDATQAHGFGHDQVSAGLNEWAADKVADALGSPWRDMVPRTVIRELHFADPGLTSGVGALSQGMPGDAHLPAPRQNPTSFRPAALWDALIGQQDRHTGNYRWDDHAGTLALIDQGYAFAVPNGRCYFNASVFVEARWTARQTDLDAGELAALAGVEGDRRLEALLKAVLRPDQVAAFYARIDRMRTNRMLLAVGEY